MPARSASRGSCLHSVKRDVHLMSDESESERAISPGSKFAALGLSVRGAARGDKNGGSRKRSSQARIAELAVNSQLKSVCKSPRTVTFVVMSADMFAIALALYDATPRRT